MKIIYILQKMVNLKIITPSNFYFSTMLFHDQKSKIIFLATCIKHFIERGHICLPMSLIKHKKVFHTNHIEIINKLWKITEIQKETWIDELLSNNAISDGSYHTPLIFYKNNCYINKFWSSEKKILKFISQTSNLKLIKKEKNQQLLNNLLYNIDDDYQKIAIILSVVNKILFIVGGPGTGKTTIISKILIAHVKLSKKKLNIQLTALTGKAATHLTESINKNIQHLKLNPDEKKIFKKKIKTLHNFLGLSPNKTVNYSNIQDNLSNLDLLIIDEISMIDITLMEQLIISIPNTTKIIFIGDYNQLPSIHGGHILKDICSYYKEGFSQSITQIFKQFSIKNKAISTIENYKFSNINNNIVMLKNNYRFKNTSEISKISEMLKKNQIDNIETLYKNISRDIKFVTLFNQNCYKKIISKISKEYKKYWIALLKKRFSFIKIMNIFNNYKLLCILKNGIFGVSGLNSAIELEMKQKGWITKTTIINDEIWYFGKPIVILNNDKNMNLVNGECGLTLLDNNKNLKVYFLNKNTQKVHIIPIHLIPKHQTNWAMTVHKSQGSEFFKVSLLLPKKNIPLLTKELIYTAITRSKKKLTIFSNEQTFMEAIKKKIIRYSGISIKNKIKF